MKNTHRFHYLNSGVIQDKLLISHSDWKMANKKMYDLDPKVDDAMRKKAIKALTGGNEWFTDQSPLYKAINTGILVQNGREYLCIVTELNN